MPIYLIAIGIVLVILIAIAIFFSCKKKLEKEVKCKEEAIPEQLSNYEIGKRQLSDESIKKAEEITDIKTLIEQRFAHTYIKHDEGKGLKRKFLSLYQEVSSLQKRMKIFSIENERIDYIIYQYEHLTSLIEEHNSHHQEEILAKNKDFFDHVLKYPLDNQQRKAIISEEDNCLVVSSAGSGKTSSIVGKVEYLTKILHVNPRKILLISYTNKAAAELTDRMNIQGLRGYTFHKLALDLLAKESKEKPSICDHTDSVFVSIFHELLQDKKIKKAILEYFVDYEIQNSEKEKKEKEKRRQLSALKSGKIKALFPDMDGNPIYVRSEQEKKLCFVLTSLGVKFRYEEAYEHPLLDELHSQYKPDFSIHYEKNGEQKRIYLENFGVDEHGMVPMWFAQSKGITYEEANQKYGDGITWKRETHKKFGTTLIETTSADFHYFDIAQKVKKKLKKAGVPYQEIPAEQLYDMVLPKNSKQEKAFIRLTVTFITLMKTNCKGISDVIKVAKKADDDRSLFIIKEIITPVYDKYVAYLSFASE